jgi:nitroreductase
MDALEAILKRKSVRSYKKEQITDEELKKLVDAGMSGPGGGAVHLTSSKKAGSSGKSTTSPKASCSAAQAL